MAAARAESQALEQAIDLAVRRVTYSAAVGAAAAVMLFRTPGARTALASQQLLRRPPLTCRRARSHARRSAGLWRRRGRRERCHGYGAGGHAALRRSR